MKTVLSHNCPARASLQLGPHRRLKSLREGGGKQLRWLLRARRPCLRANWAEVLLPGTRRPWILTRTTLGEAGISPNATESKLDSLPALPQIYKVKTL